MNSMTIKGLLRSTVFAISVISLLPTLVDAQVPMEPERARLLNGLRVLIWSRPSDQDVLLKLRIHSGAAFDLAGKSGSMALLGDLLFPDPSTREFFAEEMQGRLNVTTDYDSMTITMQGRANEFERIVEILRTALVTTPLTPENVTRIREGRVKIVKDTAISPAIVADRAIASRLFGDFPYGRPYAGTVESLERVDRADLMLARDRFLSPNNATLTVIGGVQSNRAMRALRQLLGVWRKSEHVVPATFRQPSAPDSRTLIVNGPSDQSVEVRLAVRGFKRNDTDTPTAAMLAALARQRWEKLLPELTRNPVYVRHDAHTLPGMFVMGATVDNLLAAKALASAKEVIQSLISSPATGAELELLKTQTASQLNTELAKPDGVANAWLDNDTYELASLADQVRAVNAVSSTDLQRTAARLFREAPIASVVVGNSEVLKAQLERSGKVEVMGEITPNIEVKAVPGKPQTKSSSKP